MVLVFSPQKWSHQFISKHHYAIAYSKLQRTLFFEPVKYSSGLLKISKTYPFEDNRNLMVIKICVPFPNWCRFKFPSLAKKLNESVIQKYLRREKIEPDLLLDFGCHRFIRNWNFLRCPKKVYFPVDDYFDLPIETRGCHRFLTVSNNILYKFQSVGIPMEFINHGLNEHFSKKAEERLRDIQQAKDPVLNQPIKVGYSGNLAIPFLARDLILKVVTTFNQHEFHFFGSYSDPDVNFRAWLRNLKRCKNAILHGQLDVELLSTRIFEMDILLLCYKPDNRNYHAENSHKINEYLSTGMPLVTTKVQVLEGLDFVYSSQDDLLTELRKASEELNKTYSKDLMTSRITYALSFKYEKQIEYI